MVEEQGSTAPSDHPGAEPSVPAGQILQYDKTPYTYTSSKLSLFCVKYCSTSKPQRKPGQMKHVFVIVWSVLCQCFGSASDSHGDPVQDAGARAGTGLHSTGTAELSTALDMIARLKRQLAERDREILDLKVGPQRFSSQTSIHPHAVLNPTSPPHLQSHIRAIQAHAQTQQGLGLSSEPRLGVQSLCQRCCSCS